MQGTEAKMDQATIDRAAAVAIEIAEDGQNTTEDRLTATMQLFDVADRERADRHIREMVDGPWWTRRKRRKLANRLPFGG
jgi:hypothetical protein